MHRMIAKLQWGDGLTIGYRSNQKQVQQCFLLLFREQGLLFRWVRDWFTAGKVNLQFFNKQLFWVGWQLKNDRRLADAECCLTYVKNKNIFSGFIGRLGMGFSLRIQWFLPIFQMIKCLYTTTYLPWTKFFFCRLYRNNIKFTFTIQPLR